MQWRLHGADELGRKRFASQPITSCDFQQGICLGTSQSLHPISWESSLPSLCIKHSMDTKSSLATNKIIIVPVQDGICKDGSKELTHTLELAKGSCTSDRFKMMS